MSLWTKWHYYDVIRLSRNLDTTFTLNLLMPKRVCAKFDTLFIKCTIFLLTTLLILEGQQSSSPPIVRKPLKLTLLWKWSIPFLKRLLYDLFDFYIESTYAQKGMCKIWHFIHKMNNFSLNNSTNTWRTTKFFSSYC